MISLLVFAAALATLNSDAQPQPNQPVVEQALQDPTERLFDQYISQLYDGKYAEALASAEEIEVDWDNRAGRGMVSAMRGAAMLGLKRDKQAAKLFAEAEELAPMEPYVSMLKFDSALLNDKFEVAASAMDRMIGRFPDVVRELDWDFVSFLLRNEPKRQERQNEDRRIALARLGYGGDNEKGYYLAFGAVELLMKRGDVAGASELLPHIDDPQAVENLLIQKRFAALWPELTALAGPRLQNVRSASVTAAERAYTEAPDDHEALQMLINALRHAGRFDDAIALRSKLPATSEAMAKADEQLGWAVNNLALALDEAGSGPEADALFALLNDAKIEEGRWRVSMKINRLELLVSHGKFDEALSLLDLTEASARDDGSDYARQLVRRLRYCTMSGLGRKEEAAKLLPKMLEHAADAPGPTIDGLVCAGELDQAEKLVLESLKKPEFESNFVRSLQPRPLTADDPSIWSKGWLELRKRPAVAKEFGRLGRDMPEHLLPPESANLATAAR